MTEKLIWHVVVGNVGTVYEGRSKYEAVDIYRDYRKLSDLDYGRAGNEPVTLLLDGEIYKEYFPSYQQLADRWIKENTVVCQNQCINTECKKPDIEYANEQHVGGKITQAAECLNCGATWLLVYALTDVIHINLNQD